MQENIVDAANPKVLGQRLQEARRARGLTQQEVADSLALSRTTVTALEKGERRIRPDELINLARLYGRPVSGFVGERGPVADFSVQFRTAVNRTGSPQAQQVLSQGSRSSRTCARTICIWRASKGCSLGNPIRRSTKRQGFPRRMRRRMWPRQSEIVWVWATGRS